MDVSYVSGACNIPKGIVEFNGDMYERFYMGGIAKGDVEWVQQGSVRKFGNVVREKDDLMMTVHSSYPPWRSFYE